MNKIISVFVAAVMLCFIGSAQALLANGASSDLEMNVSITLSDGAAMTFYSSYGWNGAYAWVGTTVGGSYEEDEDENGDYPSNPVSASASTNNGAADGVVTVITPGFVYLIEADAMVQDLDIGDIGSAIGYAYAWPDWLRCDHGGKATITIDYTYTLDTADSIDYALAGIYMNAFFADSQRVNHLDPKDEWTQGPPNNNGTLCVEYADAILAGDSKTITSSVSWDITIPDCSGSDSWWSLWAYGEATVDVAPVPEPATIALLGFGALALLRRRK